jgi:hypothetical protein
MKEPPRKGRLSTEKKTNAETKNPQSYPLVCVGSCGSCKTRRHLVASASAASLFLKCSSPRNRKVRSKCSSVLEFPLPRRRALELYIFLRHRRHCCDPMQAAKVDGDQNLVQLKDVKIVCPPPDCLVPVGIDTCHHQPTVEERTKNMRYLLG